HTGRYHVERFGSHATILPLIRSFSANSISFIYAIVTGNGCRLYRFHCLSCQQLPFPIFQHENEHNFYVYFAGRTAVVCFCLQKMSHNCCVPFNSNRLLAEIDFYEIRLSTSERLYERSLVFYLAAAMSITE